MNRVTSSDAWRGSDIAATDAAYGKMFGYLPIREIINKAFLNDLYDFDWYRADTVTPEQAGQLYSNRIRLMEKYLNSNSCELDDAEKAFLLRCYQDLDTPFYFDYKEGWSQLLDGMIYIMLFGYMILGFLVSGIFAGEFKYRADSLLFSTRLGRSRAPWVKILAGFLLMTALYWGCILALSAITLLYAGASGWNCPVQFDYWYSMYNLTYFQTYCLYAISGYIGMLFMGFLCMWMSSKARSAVFASALPILLLFVPNFIGNSVGDSGLGVKISSLLALLPDNLMNLPRHLKSFSLYNWGHRPARLADHPRTVWLPDRTAGAGDSPGFQQEAGKIKEALIKSARADSEEFCFQAKAGKWRNTLCISHFSARSMGAKGPLLSRRRFIQRFHKQPEHGKSPLPKQRRGDFDICARTTRSKSKVHRTSL